MEELHGNNARYELTLNEIYADGKFLGVAFTEGDTSYVRYQISAPTAERKTWHAVEVVRGGAEPFEFISLAFCPTRRKATSVIRQAWVKWTLDDITNRVQRRRDDEQ